MTRGPSRPQIKRAHDTGIYTRAGTIVFNFLIVVTVLTIFRLIIPEHFGLVYAALEYLHVASAAIVVSTFILVLTLIEVVSCIELLFEE